ncbi:MAG TPA: hypothetical protein DEP46_16145 [Blastocatellia bacterium]|nr:hypothetical protein [Blastocatellia bacterium]
MNRIFIFFIALFVSVVGLNGQSLVSGPAWRNLAPPSEEFSVDVPIELDVVTNSFESIVFEQSYQGRLGDTYFFIFSDDIEDGDGHTNVRLAVSTYTSEQIGEIPTNGKFASYSFDSGDGFFHRIMLTQTNKRIYSFHTVSLSPDDPLVKRFFSTVKIEEESPERLWNPVNVFSPDVTDPEKDGKADTGSGFASCSGPRRDPVLNPGAEASRPTVPATARISSLTITSRPKPNFTELARVYSVSGTVLVRVTFGADGRIGAITPIRRLPFGLTENAIRAAEKIQFRPRIEGGKPVTTSRTVEYSFTLY